MRPFSLRLIPVFLASLLLVGFTPTLHAQGGVVSTGDTSVPEIDPSMIGAGAALLGGITLLIRSRRKG